MRTDPDVATDCAEQLHLTLDIDDQDIAIKVVGGIVLLVGIVRSHLERSRAEQIVKRIRGVKGLTNGLSIWPRNASIPCDPEIARDIVAAIQHQFPANVDGLQVIVQNGRVALEGELDWNYQRDVIEAVVGCLRGVTLITNRIRVGERSAVNDGVFDVHGT